MEKIIQPSANIGIVGHVDHGKTTLTKLISGKWTDTHSEEIKRGITIKLGYSNFAIYKNKKTNKYELKKNKDNELINKYSIVDTPGHESLIATMISGAAVMDCAILIISADEECPQPQTREHLKTLEISGINNIIVIQNKIDLVTKEEAIENYKQIKKFLKGTIAEKAPIIPMSAEHGANLDILLKYIVDLFKIEKKEEDKEPLMYIIRSFDINKPGYKIEDIKGGIIGGTLKRGKLKKGDEIEIKPGIQSQKDGRETYTPIITEIKSISSGKDKLNKAKPGGSIAILTTLDPYLTKTDKLVGHLVGLKGTLPEPTNEITFENKLLDKVIGTKEDFEVKPIIQNEVFMLIINSLKTVGIVKKTNPKETTVILKKPVIIFDKDKVVIFRRFQGNKWHIIGHGVIKVN